MCEVTCTCVTVNGTPPNTEEDFHNSPYYDDIEGPDLFAPWRGGHPPGTDVPDTLAGLSFLWTIPPSPQKIPCTNVPAHPQEASATDNRDLVDSLTVNLSLPGKLLYFIETFKTGGAFDYKTTYSNDNYTDYGNWDFGYVCGGHFSSLTCQSAAGVARMARAITHGRNPLGSGIPFVKAPYGDQARDNQQIRNGIQAQSSGCVQ